MTFHLSHIDIRHLRVFRAVVECRGFTNAQAVLNVGQSTISNQVSQLETRLGVRLCERGRAGFEITPKGRRVYEETLKLFRAHEDFQNTTSQLKAGLRGFLSVALIDNVVTDPQCPIVRALNLFNKRKHEVSIRMEIMRPDEIEKSLLDKQIDLSIGTFHHKIPGLEYRKIYVEVNELYCGSGHPIFSLEQKDEIRSATAQARKVTRAYLDKRDLFSLGEISSTATGTVQNIEGTAVLVLGGGHIGFLPRHFAAPWVARNEMKPILPDEYVYRSDFAICTRKRSHNPHILKAFLEDLDKVAKESSPA